MEGWSRRDDEGLTEGVSEVESIRLGYGAETRENVKDSQAS